MIDERYLAIPVKGSEVWSITKSGRQVLRYSSGKVSEEGYLITTNMKGTKKSISRIWYAVPKKVYYDGTVTRVRTCKPIDAIIDHFFSKPVRVYSSSYIGIYEKDDQILNNSFIMLLPKMIPTSLL